MAVGWLIYREVKPSPEGHSHPSDKRQTIPMGSPVPGNNKVPKSCFGFIRPGEQRAARWEQMSPGAPPAPLLIGEYLTATQSERLLLF